jgi:2-polyprenyl-3-methyl-5-hydroxy-6-metoxy-1,4-benzoquinol methylase
MSVAKDMGFTKHDILKHYKRWLYVWACWASKPQKHQDILEIGPGNRTTVLRYCVNRGARVTAIDKRKKPKSFAGLGAKYLKKDFLSSRPGIYDTIYCISVFEHLVPKTRALFFSQVARSLKPGGKLYITTVQDQKVANGPNIAKQQGLIFEVPIKYMLEEKPGLKLLKSGKYTSAPKWTDESIIWKINGGSTRNKQWTEYCAVFERM